MKECLLPSFLTQLDQRSPSLSLEQTTVLQVVGGDFSFEIPSTLAFERESRFLLAFELHHSCQYHPFYITVTGLHLPCQIKWIETERARLVWCHAKLDVISLPAESVGPRTFASKLIFILWVFGFELFSLSVVAVDLFQSLSAVEVNS